MVNDRRPDLHGQQAIDLRDIHELRFWALRLHVAVEDIQTAVACVGPVAADVQLFLLRRRTAVTSARLEP